MMRTKRMLCLLLSLVMVFALPAGCLSEENTTLTHSREPVPTATTSPTEVPAVATDPAPAAEELLIAGLDLSDMAKQELLHAVQLGFPVEKLGQATISGAEMAELLDHFVEYAAPDKLAEWQALLPRLRAHEDVLTRFDAMGALFLAARTVGGGYAEYETDFASVYDALQFPWDDYYFTENLYGEHDSPQYAVPGRGDNNYLDSACLLFNLSRLSPFSGAYPFAYDAEANSIHEYVPPTYTECLLSVVRLIDSADPSLFGDYPEVEALSAERDAELKADLQASIEAILNTQTEIVHSDTFIPGKTYTGTAYYVSGDGNDLNDGRTPETAWKTLGGVIDACGYDKLKPGDAVFFRRGDTFRLSETPEGHFDIRVPNLTLSAYGEGEKPMITGSSENGAGAEKWKLVYEDESGKKIWQFYRDVSDVSMLVLNDGEALTTRVYEYYNEKGYVSCDMYGWWMHTEDCLTVYDELLPLEESMTEDLSIISRPERLEEGYIGCGTGPLFLRCDSGNPGEMYWSIEFSEYYVMGLVWLQACGVVFDNISFLCGGNSFMKNGLQWKEIKDTLIQNCEFAYGGGCVTRYRILDSGKPFMEPQGDGIYSIVRNTTVQNNYFHDMCSTTATYEADVNDPNGVDGDYSFLNNVCVNTMGIRLDSTSPSLQKLGSVIVRGNQVWNTGRMDRGKFVYSEGALAMLTPNHYDECIVEDNVFYGTEIGHELNALLDIPLYAYEDESTAQFTQPQFRNNVYVQYSGRDFAVFTSQNWEKWSIDDPMLIANVEHWFGDTASTFYMIPQD